MAAREVVRTLTVRSRQEGVPEVTRSLHSLADAHREVSRAATETTVVEDRSASKLRTVERGWQGLTGRLEGNTAAYRSFIRESNYARQALDAGITSVGRYKEVIGQLRQELQAASSGRMGFAVDQSGLNELLGIRTKLAGSARESASVFEDEARLMEGLQVKASRLRAELDPLGAAYERMNAQLAEHQTLADRQLISQDELAQASQRSKQAFDQTAASLKPVNDNIRLSAGQVQNLGYQLNDAATMLLSGSSPFQVLATQGGQVLQVLQENGGIKSSLKAIGDMALSAFRFIAPGGWVIAGFTAAAAAATFFGTKAEDRMERVNKAAEGFGKTLDAIRRSNAALADSIDKIAEASERLSPTDTANKMMADIQTQRKALDQARLGAGQSALSTGGLNPLYEAREVFGLATGGFTQIDLAKLVDGFTFGTKSAKTLRSEILALQAAGNVPSYLQPAVQQVLDFAEAAVKAQGDIDGLKKGLREMQVAAGQVRFEEASKALSGLLPNVSEAERIQRAYQEVLGRIAQMPGADKALDRDGLRETARRQRDDALAELGRPARESLKAVQDSLANFDLSPVQKQIAETTQAYDARIEEYKRTTEDAAGLADLQREKEAALGLVTKEAARAEEARRAGYALDLQAIGDVTTAQHAATAGQRAYADAIAAGYDKSYAGARAAEASTLTYAQAERDAADAVREAQTARDQAGLEGYAGQVASINAQYAEQIRLADGSTAAVKALEEARRLELEALGINTRKQLLGAQEDELRLLEVEAGLIGATDNARRLALATIQAEIDLKRQGIDVNSEMGQSYVANAQKIASAQNAIDDQTEAFDNLHDAASSFFDAIASGKGVLDSLIGALAGMNNKAASKGFDTLFGSLFGGGKSGGSSNGSSAIGSVGGSIAASSSVSTFSSTYDARSGPVAALNDNLTKVSKSALDVAKQFNGLNERADTEVLDSFLQASGTWKGMSSADYAWCASFANAAIATAGGKGTGSNAASSFMNWGTATNAPKPGDIVVLKPQAQGTTGHVGFVAGFGDGTVQVFGGNQSGGANTQSYKLNQVRGYRTYEGAAQTTSTSIYTDQKVVARGVAEGIKASAYDMGGYDAGTPSNPTGSSGGFLSGLFGKQIASPGTFLGMQHNGLTIGQGLGTAAGAFSGGYQSGSAVGGALSGAMAGASGGPIGMAIGAIAGALGGGLGGRAQRKAAHQAANAEWEQVRPQYQEFDRQLSGEGTGNLRTMITGLWGQLDAFMEKGGKAWKMGKGNSTAEFAATGTKMFTRWAEEIHEFQDGFQYMLDDLTSGQGLQGAFANGRAQVKKLDEEVKNFIDDVEIAFGSNDIGIQTSAEFDAMSERTKADRERRVADAKRAAGEYALTMLYTAETQTEVEKAMDSFKGTAAGLLPILTKLGWTAEEAAKAIDERLTAAIADMRKTFETDIADRISDLKGEGYVSAVRDFLEQFDTLQADAKRLGADTSNFGELFRLELQEIVDGAELTGSAFDDLVKAFPQLSGVVKEFAANATVTATQLKENYASFLNDRLSEATQKRADAESALLSRYQSTVSFVEGLQQRLTDLDLGDDSSLSGAEKVDAARARAIELAAKAQAGDVKAQDELGSALDDLLRTSKDFNVSSEAFWADQRLVKDILTTTAVKTQTQLDQLKASNSFLQSIDENTASLGTLLEKLNEAIAAQTAAQKLVDGNRTFGANPERNRLIDAGIKQLGLNYTGSYGFQADGSDPFRKWREGLPAEQLAAVLGVINAYIGINRADGGAVWGAGTSTSDSIRANLSNGEFVVREAAARSLGYDTLGHMNRTGTLPPTVMPFMPRLAVANDRQSDAAIIAALQESNRLLRLQVQTTGQGFRENTDAVQAGNRTAKQGELASRRASSNRQEAA